MNPIRTAILGTGFMGRVHLEALRRTEGVEVVAIAGRTLDSARKLAAGYGIPRATGDAGELLSDPAIDAVHICTPNNLHFPQVRQALLAGKHVLCEKPLATTVAEAEELVRLARERGLRNCVCHNLRYYPMVQQIRSMRENGDLGRILIVQGTYSQDWLLDDTAWNWRIDSAAGALRTMGDVGTHWFDMVEHVTGLRVQELCADLQTFIPIRHREHLGKREDIAIETEDYGAVLFHLGAQARGTMTATQMAGGRKNRLSIEVYGTKASAAWNQERPDELWIGHNNAPNQILIKNPTALLPGAAAYADLPAGHSEGYDDTFKQVFRRFYRSIREPGTPAEYPQLIDGLRHMQIMQAQLESHRERRWIAVPQFKDLGAPGSRS